MSSVIREGYKFCQEIVVPCYQTDGNKQLRPAAFLDLAQEVAFWAAEGMGFGYDTLHIHHTAWALSRIHVHFLRIPSWRDRVKIYTWHKGPSGPFFLRDFILQDADGAPLAVSTSSWVVMDERTRRLVRPEEMAHLLSLDYAVDDAIVEPAPKLILPRDGQPEDAGEHVVTYSDVDLLGHTNNARYLVWAMDCIPMDAALQPMKNLFINFSKETRPGERVQLLCLQDGDAWYVEGKVEGRSCFSVKMEF